MSRKVTVQLVFEFRDDFTDDDIKEHVDTLLHLGVNQIDECLLQELAKKPTRKKDKVFQAAAVSMYRDDKARLQAALKTKEIIQIEG